MLQTLGKRPRLIASILHLLEWDQETYMPPGGIAFRSEQRELLAELLHIEENSPQFISHLSQLIDLETGKVLVPIGEAETAALREWRRDLLRHRKLPIDFVRAFAKTTSQATHAWADAKRKQDFSLFAPHLKEVVRLSREKATLLGGGYNALIDEFEPGMTVTILDTLFQTIKPKLLEIRQLAESRPTHSLPDPKTTPKKTLRFCQRLLKAIGLDPRHSRCDLSAHPFCSGGPQDLRLTIHGDTPDLFANISAALHEGGHALYTLGLDPQEFGSPLGEATSLGLHESQSRFYECYLGHSLPFCRYLLPRLKKSFPTLRELTPETLFAGLNRVQASFIRIHADEVTYPLHIILRYELEKALVDGNLSVDAIPALWNAKTQELLGITPPHDGLGCLQDVHWSLGVLGYFPTYVLGTIYAAHWLQALHQALPTLDTQIEQGQFKPMLRYLRKNIHIHGRRFLSQELIERVTGASLDPNVYLSYLEEKYSLRPLDNPL